MKICKLIVVNLREREREREGERERERGRGREREREVFSWQRRIIDFVPFFVASQKC